MKIFWLIYPENFLLNCFDPGVRSPRKGCLKNVFHSKALIRYMNRHTLWRLKLKMYLKRPKYHPKRFFLQVFFYVDYYAIIHLRYNDCIKILWMICLCKSKLSSLLKCHQFNQLLVKSPFEGIKIPKMLPASIIILNVRKYLCYIYYKWSLNDRMIQY